MIKIKTFGTGSSGNCYLIDDGKSQLIIEAGVSYHKVEQAMDFNFRKVAGIFISHEHTDHSRAIRQWWKQTSIHFYGSKGTFEALGVGGGRYTYMPALKPIVVGSWLVTAFSVKHDAAAPMGFLFENSEHERLLYVTDTYFVEYKFKNVNYMMVEMNYSREIGLQNVAEGLMDKARSNRLNTSHFEMNDSLEFIKSNTSPALKQVILIHLSELNSNEALFKRRTQEITGVPVMAAPKSGVIM